MTFDKKKKILITDDHQIVRRGLIEMIYESPIDADLIECSNGAETFAGARENQGRYAPLRYISSWRESGLEVLKRVRLFIPKFPSFLLQCFHIQITLRWQFV